MKNSLIFAFAIIGTLIGAGYATGQELYSFFVMKSNIGYLYFSFSVLFIILINITIYFYAAKNGITEIFSLYTDIYKYKLGTVLFLISLIYLFICFSITVTGTGCLFEESFKLPFFIGASLIIIISYAAVFYGLDGVFIVNAVLTPFIIISIIILGLISIVEPKTVSAFMSFEKIKSFSVPFSFCMLYAGYNMFSILPITVSCVKKYDRKSIIKGFLISFLIIFITGIIILFSLYKTDLNIDNYQIPFLKIVSYISVYSQSIYTLILYFSMLTTGVSCFYGFIYSMTEYFNIDKGILMIISLILCVLLSFIGFSSLVRKLYSLFGLFGVFIMVSLAYLIYKKN